MASIRFDESCNLIGQFEVRIFAVMPSIAVAGHYEIFNALQNKTGENSECIYFLKKYKLL